MNIEKVVRVGRLAGAVILVLASVSCGDMAREGQASSYLIITSLQASSGETDEFGGELRSDVLTNGGIINDNGQVEFVLAMKDPTLIGPTSANFITIDRYHVKYIRADGRNTQGVDVPYEFDGAITGTVADRRCDFRLHARPPPGEGRGAAGRARVEFRDRVDHRGSHLLRARSDRPGGQRHGQDQRPLRELRGSRINHLTGSSTGAVHER